MKLIVYPKGSNSVTFIISMLVVTDKIIDLTLHDEKHNRIFLKDLNGFKVLEDINENK